MSNLPNQLVLDTSVVLKFIIKEKDSFQAVLLFEKIFEDKPLLLAPFLLKTELISVVRKKEKLEEITSKQAGKARELFYLLDINYVNENKEILEDAYKLSKELYLTVIYDCLYLALAKNKNALFITADKKFYKKAKAEYKRIKLLKNFS
jgi:predicted nucleic acid-binding protein